MTKYCLANIDELSKEIFRQNVEAGWWDDMDRCVYTCIQLIVTEIAEATEGERKNLMDDHLPHRKMGEVELADALIRTLDLMGRFDIKIFDYVNLAAMAVDMEKWIERDLKNWTVPRMHLWIVGCCTALADCFEYSDDPVKFGLTEYFCHLTRSILAVALVLNYDIFGAMEDKVTYNRHRADHKREERAKENGKKF